MFATCTVAITSNDSKLHLPQITKKRQLLVLVSGLKIRETCTQTTDLFSGYKTTMAFSSPSDDTPETECLQASTKSI